MAQITTKELAAIEDVLTLEQNLITKLEAYAATVGDTELRQKYEQIAARHQRHYDEIYSNLR